MKIHKLLVEGYKRIENSSITFGDATFLIGPNNTGKSSVLGAITHLLSANKRIPESEYYSVHDSATNERKTVGNKIILEAEFRDVPRDAVTWRGFKGRIFNYDGAGTEESGLCILYRKTYELGKDVIVELKSKVRTLQSRFEGAAKPQDLIDAGINPVLVKELFEDIEKKFTAASKLKFNEIDEMWDIGSDEVWFQNPGGIPGVVLSRLPRYIVIPAHTASDEMTGGVLHKTLNELFEDVRTASRNYQEAQKYLNELAKELDPANSGSEFGKMMNELNGIIGSVFPESKLHATADLSDPNKSLKPSFSVELQSNIRTPVEHQGAGMIRSAVFGILRFRQKWLSRREDQGVHRSIIIGFEEPEMYLHPSAANQMRDTIYDLSANDSQIIATTHSPYLIDLSRKPRQVLNRFSRDGGPIKVMPFNVTEAYNKLTSDDKNYVKMLIKIDDYVARVFFARRVVVVEGDTEEIVIRESLRRLPRDSRLKVTDENEVVKARGKATIIGLVKYLKILGISAIVIHDRDAGVAGAEKFNDPIQRIAEPGNVYQLDECIENVLGYEPPNGEKPYTAYLRTLEWGDSWTDIPDRWRLILEKVFNIS